MRAYLMYSTQADKKEQPAPEEQAATNNTKHYNPVIALNARKARGLVVEAENTAEGHFVVDAIAEVAAATADGSTEPITYVFEGEPSADRYGNRYVLHKTLDVITARGKCVRHYDANELAQIPEFDAIVRLMNTCCISLLSYAFIADRTGIIAAWGHNDLGQLEYTTNIDIEDLL